MSTATFASLRYSTVFDPRRPAVAVTNQRPLGSFPSTRGWRTHFVPSSREITSPPPPIPDDSPR